MSPSGKKNRSLALLEEALQVLRTGGASILLLHWTGTIPFAISLLWLFRDSGFTWGGPLLLRDSLICALAFVWMSYWKGLASRSTMTMLTPDAEKSPDWLRNILIQTVFQSLKLFVMPLAIASALAWPAATLFFRTLSLQSGTKSRPIRTGLANAFSAATSGYAENAVAFLTLAAFSVVAFLNLLITFFLLPSLWRILTGYETDWSKLENPGIIFGLFTVTVIATWLLIDPWIQTYSVLRAFYQNSRLDGRDLLREISRLAATIAICLLFFHSPVQAQSLTPAPASQQALDTGIDRVSKDIDYGWLRPKEVQNQPGFLNDLANKINDMYTSAKATGKQWSRSFFRWLRDLLRQQDLNGDDGSKLAPHADQLRWTLGILAVMICGAIIALFLRSRRRHNIVQADAASGTNATPDVLNEQILPSDVSQEEWLRLALEYLANNQTRLAARAFYLANLSYLGNQSFLSLALWKSNRLYERELARQPQAEKFAGAFASCNRLYERAWFGMRELGMEQIELMRGKVEQLRDHA